MIHHVEAPIEKVKQLILKEHPQFYAYSEALKAHIIKFWVKPVDHKTMYQYIKKECDKKMKKFSKFVDFTGEENEKEFLEKCVKQWSLTVNQDIPEVLKVCQLGTIFSEIQHRIRDIE